MKKLVLTLEFTGADISQIRVPVEHVMAGQVLKDSILSRKKLDCASKM